MGIGDDCPGTIRANGFLRTNCICASIQAISQDYQQMTTPTLRAVSLNRAFFNPILQNETKKHGCKCSEKLFWSAQWEDKKIKAFLNHTNLSNFIHLHFDLYNPYSFLYFNWRGAICHFFMPHQTTSKSYQIWFFQFHQNRKAIALLLGPFCSLHHASSNNF